MHSLPRTVQWYHARRTRQFGAFPIDLEVPHARLRSSLLRGSAQVQAAHAHHPSTGVIETGTGAGGSAAAIAAAAGGSSVFSYLGLGSCNSDTVDGDGAAAPGGAAAAGDALLLQLRRAQERLGSSVGQLFFDGVAEGLSGMTASQIAAILMLLALGQRRPDDAWLDEYWAVCAAKLSLCTTADLAMLSFGLSKLQLQPPPGWTEALLAATLRLAEAPPEAATAAAADDGAEKGRRSLGATLQLLLQEVTSSPSESQPRSRQWLAAAGGGGGHRNNAHSLSAALGRLLPGRYGSSAGGLTDASGGGVASDGGRSVGPAEAWLPTSAASAARGGGERDAVVSATSSPSAVAAVPPPPIQRPINSAYDMEDLFGDRLGPETSSGIAELLLGPLQAAWAGLRGAAAGVTAAWRHSRAGSELVTVAYNLTAAGVPVGEAWLARFLQVMRPRLGDLSGDDLRCLLIVAAEAVSGGGGGAAMGGGGGSGSGLVEAVLTREWRAALFARMDGINWALQRHHLVGCLGSISALGLRPPPPWLRRQLRSLQAGLQFLPTPELVQVGGLLPIFWEGAAAAPPAAAGPAAAAGDDAADRAWFEQWLAEYRAAISERHTTMEAADLLAVIAGVAAVSAELSAPASATTARRDVASLPPRSGEMPYSEWRRAMVDAVAARLPESSLAGLCEAWQVLADAKLVEEQQQRLARGGSGGGWYADAGIVPAVSSSPLADDTAEQFEGLRKMVASRLAVHPGQLFTSDVAPVLSSLAAAGLPLPPPTLESLLGAAQPLLPGLTSAELVTVALSLVRMSYKPNLAWQAAFCAATRRRLALMTPPQRCSLLVASASLGLHLPEPWVRDFFAVSERGLGEQLDGTQLANLLWAVSCVAPEPAGSWMLQWECASMPRLRELGPNMLAVVLKAMSTLHYRPSLAWQSAFFAALQRRLFVAGAAQLIWPTGPAEEATAQPADPAARPASTPSSVAAPDASSCPTSSASTALASEASAAASRTSAASERVAAELESQLRSAYEAYASGSGHLSAAAARPASDPYSSPSHPAPSSYSSSSASTTGTPSMLSSAVTAEALSSLVYSLASLDLAPPAAWMDELADAIRCKLSLMSTLDLSVVLAYLVARGHRPHDEWWESFLEALESRFDSLSAGEMSSLLVMLNALRVSPTAQWLDAFCAATQHRLASSFQPAHLLQVLSCLHLFRHRPEQAWMAAYTGAVEGALPRFNPTELARAMMLLDNLNQRPPPGFMRRFYDFSRPGLAQLDTQELVNVAWAVVSCSTLQPDVRWVEALVEAARPRLASLQQPQLRVLVAALSHMQRGAPSQAAGDFLAFSREFLLA